MCRSDNSEEVKQWEYIVAIWWILACLRTTFFIQTISGLATAKLQIQQSLAYFPDSEDYDVDSGGLSCRYR